MNFKENKFITNTVCFFRNLLGITTEKLDYKFHLKRQPNLIQKYFNSVELKKLQIGCQSHPMLGWLNVDLVPKHLEIVFMDATKTFPFPDESFEHIFSEHMIEHISFKEGLFMLKECFRVLKKGGKIRISTPNFAFLIALYNKEKTEEQIKYIEFSKKYLDQKLPVFDTIVINNFFNNWGHQFIYDEKSLRYIIENSGFSQFKTFEINKSEDLNFCNLEKHGLEISDAFNILESIVIEAKKPL